MDYETPVVEVVGEAGELIQTYLGPRNDGGGWTFSYGLAICSVLEN